MFSQISFRPGYGRKPSAIAVPYSNILKSLTKNRHPLLKSVPAIGISLDRECLKKRTGRIWVIPILVIENDRGISGYRQHHEPHLFNQDAEWERHQEKILRLF